MQDVSLEDRFGEQKRHIRTLRKGQAKKMLTGSYLLKV
jgi:hypothetical protein